MADNPYAKFAQPSQSQNPYAKFAAPQEQVDSGPPVALADDPNKIYGTILPFAQDKRTGKNELAFPEIIRGPVQVASKATQEMFGERPIDERTALEAATMGLGAPAAKAVPEALAAGKGALTAGKDALVAIPNAMPNLIKSDPVPAALTARLHGYVLPPQMASEEPGLVSNILAGWSGKIKTAQEASVRNQEVTNDLASAELGVPKGTMLTDNVFNDIRKQAGKAYEAVEKAIPAVDPDESFKDKAASLGGRDSQAAKYFPELMKNKQIKNLVSELQNAGPAPTRAWMELTKELRANGNANLKSIGSPKKHALGLAQREAAGMIDDLIDRRITETAGADPSKVSLVKAYRDARQLIAKTYDVEGATNPTTGDVSAWGLGRLADKGKPLSGNLKTIADTALAFPKAVQNSASFGGSEKLSALDFFGTAAALAHGNPSVAAAILGRPAARSLLLSRPYQNRMIPTGKGTLDDLTQQATQ